MHSTPAASASPLLLPPADSPQATPELVRHLAAHGLIDAERPLALEPAGESNMNLVWRARQAGRPSLILKQSRPYVAKYPSIPAPIDRAEAEARFYHLVGNVPALAARLPRLLHHDPAHHLLVFEDLAPAAGCETLYAGDTLTQKELEQLANWLAALHALRPVDPGAAPDGGFANREMRALNHAHVFDLPLRPEGPFDALLEGLTPGLAAEASSLRVDPAYVAAVRRLGAGYLGDHPDPRLIHGDFFPGSLLRQPAGGLRVIDPEFAFFGDPAFDLGVFAAHLVLSGQTSTLVESWFDLTITTADAETRARARALAGVEIMRRLIGVAQLPLTLPLEAKAALLALSREWVLAGPVA